MKKTSLFLLLLLFFTIGFSQKQNPANDTEAAALLQKVSEKYKAYKNISAEFKLILMRPKLKPEQDDKKFTDTIVGKVLLQQTKFNVTAGGQQLICDGINIWTYTKGDKEIQVDLYQESDEAFSPSKLFSLYKEGYLYQTKESKTINGKKQTVIEMSPSNKKATFFKIDVTVDETTLQITESKIYEKNGARYIYKLIKQTPNVSTTEQSFTYDAKKFAGVKVVDLR